MAGGYRWRHASTAPDRRRGFTLIELMIAIVIVSVLAAVAFPSYQSHLIDSNRSIAKAALLDVAARQEAYLLNRKAYTDDMTDLGLPTNPALIDKKGQFLLSIQPDGFVYEIRAVLGPGANQFTATATPAGIQAKDTECGILSLISTGQKMEGGTGSVYDCW